MKIDMERVVTPQFFYIKILDFGKNGADPIHTHNAYMYHVYAWIARAPSVVLVT